MYLQQESVDILENFSYSAPNAWDSWTAEANGSLPGTDVLICKRTDRTFLEKALQGIIFFKGTMGDLCCSWHVDFMRDEQVEFH